MIRVFVVDDEKLVRRGIIGLIDCCLLYTSDAADE